LTSEKASSVSESLENKEMPEPGKAEGARVFNNLHRVFHSMMKTVEVDIKPVKADFFAENDKI
jgi:hypothetical protein